MLLNCYVTRDLMEWRGPQLIMRKTFGGALGTKRRRKQIISLPRFSINLSGSYIVLPLVDVSVFAKLDSFLADLPSHHIFLSLSFYFLPSRFLFLVNLTSHQFFFSLYFYFLPSRLLFCRRSLFWFFAKLYRFFCPEELSVNSNRSWSIFPVIKLFCLSHFELP